MMSAALTLRLLPVPLAAPQHDHGWNVSAGSEVISLAPNRERAAQNGRSALSGPHVTVVPTTLAYPFRVLCVSVTFRLWSPCVATADRAWSHSSGSASGRGSARWIRPRVVMMAPL